MASPVFCLLQASLATPVCVSPPPFILHSLHILHIQHFCFTIFKEFAVFVLNHYKDFTSRLSCQMAVGMESVSSGFFFFVNVSSLLLPVGIYKENKWPSSLSCCADYALNFDSISKSVSAAATSATVEQLCNLTFACKTVA